MEAFLIKAQKVAASAAIFCLGISLGIMIVSQAHASDKYGLTGLALTCFLAGGSYAYYTARQKFHQETP